MTETTPPTIIRGTRSRKDLTEQQHRLRAGLGSYCYGVTSGWLNPYDAWTLYSQNGAIKHLIQRMALLMASKGWAYTRSDVPFDWSGIMSRQQSLGYRQVQRTCVTWMMIFGGAGAIIDADDTDRSWAEPLIPSRVKRIRKLIPKTAAQLRPETGKTWADCEYFTVWGERNQMRQKVHRSRVLIFVSGDVPDGSSGTGAPVYNTSTGWPPSWIEGIYRPYVSWQESELASDRSLKTASLLYVKLKNLAEVQRSPSEEEQAQIEAEMDAVSDDLNTEDIVWLDADSSIEEVSRNLAGLADMAESKRLNYVAATGYPRELVEMVAVGNLGDNSGPIKAFNQIADANREDVFTQPTTKLTDLQLEIAKRDPEVEDVPTEYTIEFDSVQQMSDKDQSDKANTDSKRRETDAKWGLPFEVIASDPTLDDAYTGMSMWREAESERRKQAEAAGVEAEEAAARVPTESMESAAEIAKRLGMSAATILKLRAAGVIPGQKIGSRWKFVWSKVWEALEAAEATTPEAAEAELEEAEKQGEGEGTDRLDRPGRRGAGPERAEHDDHRALQLSEATSFGPNYGASTAMREIFWVLERVGPSMLPVLITGETGTGKEGLAAGLADLRGGPFEAVNCGALPVEAPALVDVLEGALERAKGGTLFLDEIGELFGPQQAAMLRALAGDRDVRLVSATWRSLEPPMFRQDLYQRLAGVEVEVPPLRERDGDIVHLAKMFATMDAREAGLPELDEPFSPSALIAMRQHSWPGNVRELRTAVTRGALFAGPGARITAEHMQI